MQHSELAIFVSESSMIFAGTTSADLSGNYYLHSEIYHLAMNIVQYDCHGLDSGHQLGRREGTAILLEWYIVRGDTVDNI